VEILTTVEQVWSEPERRRLARLCTVLTGDPDVADDLAQETLLQAWQIRHRLTDPAGSGPWLDAVARNVCRRWRVRNARLRAHEQPAPTVPEVTDLLEHEELVELLDRALGLLPADTRDALVARYVEEVPPREIASRMATTPEAVSMRLTRGKARLREVIETDLAGEPLARTWMERQGAAWRTTRLVCATCGRASMSLQRDETAVRLRCDHCDPGGVASSWSLTNPALGPRLAALHRPSAMVARMADWSAAWWPAAIAQGVAPCTRCGRDVSVAAYHRDDDGDPRWVRGWHASCVACGEVLSTSLLGLLLVTPEARTLRRVRPAAHAVPTRRDGDRLVVGLRDAVSGAGVDAVFDERSTRLVRVVPVA
jgi:RNA polymerase sigma-70 factor (ECF subfamily)